eukprot:13960761-Ditylum_brightwellii.AAC.1
MVGCPSLADFKNMARMNLFPDLSFSVKDINNGEFVFGPDVGALRGKTSLKTQEPARTDHIKVPQELINLHQEVIMAANILYINKIPFCTSVLRNIKFTTTKNINNRKKSTLLTAIKKIFKFYMSQGFVVINALMDREFEPLAEEFLPTKLNSTPANEHVPGIEWQNKFIKEWVRSINCMLPFKKIPNIIITEMVTFSIIWLNAFPPKSRILSTFSQRLIICGSNLSYMQHCKIPFGAYVQTLEENLPTNSMANRTIGTIALGPSMNLQGEYKFMNLETGQLIH